jgi:hypothetical protein
MKSAGWTLFTYPLAFSCISFRPTLFEVCCGIPTTEARSSACQASDHEN